MKLEFNFFVVIFHLSFFELTHQREMILEKVEAIPEPNIFVFDSLRVKKFNRSCYVLDGELTIKQDLDNAMDFTAGAYNLAGGQYKKIAEKKMLKFCESWYDETMREFHNDLTLFSNFPEYGTCPWKAGKYWIKNYVIKNDKLLPAYMPGGENWKMEFRFFTGKNLIAGYNVYIKVTKDIPFG